MRIRDIFVTSIEERVEPVVKVSDRRPIILHNELKNLIVTPQWERYLYRMLEEYTDAFDREDVQGIGFWISGFFGSGKSLLMKVLGVLLEGGELQGKSVHQLFLDRLPPDNEASADLERFLSICRNKVETTVIGGNLHAQQASGEDALTVIVFRLFAEARGYSRHWPFAWAVEYQMDRQGLSEEFHRVVSELSGLPWEDVAIDSSYYHRELYEAAVRVLPDRFESPDTVEKAVEHAVRDGITPVTLIDRLARWCLDHDKPGRTYKLLLQLDELGQWFTSGTDPRGRSLEVQTLVETASERGLGRIWIVVTAHGDVQMLRQSSQQELYLKINQRFSVRSKLSNEDINEVVQKRLLFKRGYATDALRQLFNERSGEIIDLGTIHDSLRPYPVPDGENFARFYPYLPWSVVIIPDIIKGIAQAAGQEEVLSGSNRTMMGVVQGGIIDTPAFLDEQVGKLLCLADLYNQISVDAPSDTKTDLALVHTGGDDEFTTQVARALYLLGQAGYSPTPDEPGFVPCTAHNVTLALVSSLDTDVAALRSKVERALERLVNTRYAKRVGDAYQFLNRQQRNFQDKILNRVDELSAQPYDLSQLLQEYSSEDALRFTRVPISGLAGLEKVLRMELDGHPVRTGAFPSEVVTVKVFSPLQRLLDPEIEDDMAMKYRSGQEPNNLFFRMGQEAGLRRALAYAVATREVAEQVISTRQEGDPEKEVAQRALRNDVPMYRREVRHALGQAVRSGIIFFRGSERDLMYGDSPAESVRNTLGYLLTNIYTRISQVPSRIANAETTIHAALKGDITQNDLRSLNIYNADGSLNEGHPLLTALRGKLPQAENDQGMMSADKLRSEFEQPPYGWDGNWVKVGLALLLRVSACRLYHLGDHLNDPNHPKVLQVLLKEQDFKALRVQGVRNTLDQKALQNIRSHIETIFRIKPVLVPATLSNALEAKLKEIYQTAGELEYWETTARCPLPHEFGAGKGLVEDLLSNTVPSSRLALFEEQWQQLLRYVQLQEELERFRVEYGSEYVELRDFYNSMLYVEGYPEGVHTFIADWNAATRANDFTNLTRWDGLRQAYRAAKQALEEQVAMLQQGYRRELAELEAALSKRLQDAGVPTEHLTDEMSRLSVELREGQDFLAQSRPGFSEALNMRQTLARTRMNLQRGIYEAGARYQSSPSRQASEQPQDIRLNWRDLMGQVRISSPEDLERVVNTLKRFVNEELAHQRVVIIE